MFMAIAGTRFKW